MCLKALHSLVSEAMSYIDLAYVRVIKFMDNSLILKIETDFFAGDLLASANANAVLESNKTVRTLEVKSHSLDRLVRKIRPSHQLQRNFSKSSVTSDCSERLHEYLRLQESLSSFPVFQETSSLFWRKKPKRGKHRSLQGNTVLIPPR